MPAQQVGEEALVEVVAVVDTTITTTITGTLAHVHTTTITLMPMEKQEVQGECVEALSHRRDHHSLTVAHIDK